MDRSHKSEEAFNQSMSSSSRRVMWKLTDEEETFDSLVQYRRVPARNVCVSAQQPKVRAVALSEPEQRPRKRTASENWLMLLRELRKQKTTIKEREQSKKASDVHESAWKHNHSSATSLPEVKEPSVKERADAYWQRLFTGTCKRRADEKEMASAGAEQEDPADIALTVKPSLALRYKPSHESLKYKRSKDLGSERLQSTSRGPTKLVTDLKVESFCLPPQQKCVVREMAPKFAQRMHMSLANDTDSCCSGDLEVPTNSPVLDLDVNSPPQQPQMRPRTEIISVHISTPPRSTPSFAETTGRSTSPIKRRVITNKITTGTKGSSTAAASSAGGNKCSSASSGSTGPHLPTFRQRQQELHRYRILIEKRRLDLLELKIAREREEALHSELLFHKDLQIKEHMLKVYEDNDCSNA
ncbi:uncharacterized protein [Drosophila bipectinata]|uniref:uncharacterized protein n=1 Tax=Drosophila bipectinata TaxID=42026 RepID=UPI001C8A0C02|nr:uncharacterized protein LOC108121053 [Drosophila bipectinata]